MEPQNPLLTFPHVATTAMEVGVGHMLAEVMGHCAPKERTYLEQHFKDTPRRVVKAYQSLMEYSKVNPASVLKTKFREPDCDEMVSVVDIEFVSLCMHHLLPFHGKVHFAYLPNKYVVGLSKIPRMVDILARRPQLQERLTRQIVDVFQREIQPHGCGVIIDAWHGCVGVRGVRKPGSKMRTIALTGWFRSRPAVKQEFLTMVFQGNGGK